MNQVGNLLLFDGSMEFTTTKSGQSTCEFVAHVQEIIVLHRERGRVTFETIQNNERCQFDYSGSYLIGWA